MKHTLIIAVLMAILTCLSACTPEKNHTALLPELQQAEAVMYEHPDSALHLLQEMQTPASSDKLQKATWALLLVQAKYKNYIEEVTDSTFINIAHDYFMKQEDAQRRAMVLYYKGILYKKAGKTEEAQKLYLMATEEVDKIEDYQLAHLIYIELGELYIFRGLYEDTFKNIEKALHYAELANNDKYRCSSYIFLARATSALDQTNTSIEYYQKAIRLAEKTKDNYLCSGAMNELAGIYTNIKDHQAALKYAQKALQIKETDKIESLGHNFLVLGEIYYHLAISDSAYYYFNKALYSSSIYTVRSAYQGLYYLSRKNQDYKKMSIYCDQLLNYQDSIQVLNKSRELAEIQKKYDQQKVINEKNQLKIKKDRIIRNMLIALTAMCCLTALLIYIYQRKLIRKERIIQKNEKEMQLSALKRQENERIISRNQSRMKELEEQMEANKGVQEELEDQKAVLAEIKQQNETLQQENALLQQHIDSHTSSQGEKSQEADRLSLLGEENQRLHDRERFLSNQLIKKTELLHQLKTNPQYMEDKQWEQVKETMNQLFDNYLTKLSRLVPALTESDLQICCFIKLGIPNPGIAELLAISPASVSKRKLRLKERIIQQTGSFDKGQTLDLWLWEF